MREHDFSDQAGLDLMLDAALSTYGEPVPGDGLEDRMLAGITVESGKVPVRPKRRQRWLTWAVPLPLAAGLLLIWGSTHKITRSPKTEASRAEAADQAPIIVPSHKLNWHAERSFEATKHRAHLRQSPPGQVTAATTTPKLDVFPAPQPLSREERTLAMVAKEAPLPLRKALIEAQDEDNLLPHIAVLHFPPLQSPDEGQP